MNYRKPSNACGGRDDWSMIEKDTFIVKLESWKAPLHRPITFLPTLEGLLLQSNQKTFQFWKDTKQELMLVRMALSPNLSHSFVKLPFISRAVRHINAIVYALATVADSSGEPLSWSRDGWMELLEALLLYWEDKRGSMPMATNPFMKWPTAKPGSIFEL